MGIIIVILLIFFGPHLIALIWGIPAEKKYKKEKEQCIQRLINSGLVKAVSDKLETYFNCNIAANIDKYMDKHGVKPSDDHQRLFIMPSPKIKIDYYRIEIDYSTITYRELGYYDPKEYAYLSYALERYSSKWKADSSSGYLTVQPNKQYWEQYIQHSVNAARPSKPPLKRV